MPSPDLEGAYLKGASLRGADLRSVDLTRAFMQDADLRDAQLSGATLVNADLKDANLDGAQMNYSDLTGATLWGASLRKASLSSANLCAARLEGADLSESHLYDADLASSWLVGASLRGAVLTKAMLCRAKLAGVDFADAFFGGTIFGDNDLSEARNLHTCHHVAPSCLDNLTMLLSPKLPESFLRGCGLREWQVEAAKLLDQRLTATQVTENVYHVHRLRSEAPIQIHNLFISYSQRDAEFVNWLESHLLHKGILSWRDVHDAPAGPLEAIVVRAIKDNPTVLLVLSKNSTTSDWVEFEIEEARRLEKELRRNVLCPIALDDSWENAAWSRVLMNQVRKYNILDFSSWKDLASGNAQFDRLLKGLDLYYRPASADIRNEEARRGAD